MISFFEVDFSRVTLHGKCAIGTLTKKVHLTNVASLMTFFLASSLLFFFLNFSWMDMISHGVLL